MTAATQTLPTGGIAAFTVIEDAALIAWLYLARSAKRAAKLIAAPLLALGLFAEHVVATNVKRGDSLLNLQGIPYGRLAVNAVLETAIWVIWLLLWPWYQFSIFGVGIPAVAIAFLEVGLIVEHNLTDNIFHGRPLLQDLFHSRVYGFSTIENAGSAAWLGLIGAGHPVAGAAALVAFQFVEHRMAIQLGRR